MNDATSQNLEGRAAPTIWEFVDPLQFLQKHYEYRKAQSQGFSYGSWAQELGLKSRSFLRLVLLGKRSLTENLALQLSQNLRLKKTEAQFWLHLVGLQRATQFQTKEYHSQEISKLRQKFFLSKHSILEVPQKDLFEFLSSYRIPRLQVLLSLERVHKTTSNLAKTLEIKESEVTEMLATLQKLNLASVNTGGEWQATQTELGTPDVLGHIALQSFHKKSLEEAIHALTMPVETRRYQSSVLVLTQDQMLEIHKELRDTFDRMIQKFDGSALEASSKEKQKIYQMNFNIIPVTGPIDRATEHAPAGSEGKSKEKENV